MIPLFIVYNIIDHSGGVGDTESKARKTNVEFFSS